MKIAFAILAHQHPYAATRLVRALVGAGHVVAMHFDARGREADYRALQQNFAGNPSVRIVREYRVAWGQWSIVAATLACLDEIAAAGWEPDYVYLASGADYPIRPVAELEAFLTRHRGKEFIECVPADRLRWVRGGLQEERYRYRFYFNWRAHPTLFEIALNVQKWLGLKRKFVRGFEPQIGSQWWVLSWTTLKQIMALAREKDVLDFFRTTLIPDELFFQTLVYHFVPDKMILGRTLTLYQFTDYGVPAVYYADHLDYLSRQPFFMARKISPHNPALFDALDARWQGRDRPEPVADTAIGTVGPEYERRRIAYRDGPPGLPIAGRAPNKWSEDLGRLKTPFFAVIGLSAAGMLPIYRALSCHPDLLCHGQLFHPKRIEFAGDAAMFAGYDAQDIAQRNISAPNFVADVVRAEKRRMSGFLLRWGQGWHLHEVMFDRPNIRVAVVKDDPLFAFIESLTLTSPLMDAAIDPSSLLAMAPEALTQRFERFIPEYRAYATRIVEIMRKSADAKPDGRVIEIDSAALIGSLELETWLGIAPDWRSRVAMWDAVKRDLARLEELRCLALERLLAGGASRRLLDQMSIWKQLAATPFPIAMPPVPPEAEPPPDGTMPAAAPPTAPGILP